ncbi:MAG: SDH family Clp fold serine proteinase [Patescibacteria group bacterium]|jgi:ClpP class serine protease
MPFSEWIWILLLAGFFIFPWLREYIRREQRDFFLRQIEKKRGTRVIAIIQRSRLPSLLGLLFSKFLSLDDSEKIVRLLRKTDKNKPIDLIIHSPGGLVIAARQIAQALRSHKAKITAFVPYYALSGGTYIALAADEIVMDKNAILSQLDPQIANMPAVSIQEVLKKKKPKDIDDKTIVLADISEKAIRQTQNSLAEILQANNYTKKQSKKIVSELISSKYTHDNAVDFEDAKRLGLRVRSDIPKEIYDLMELYGVKDRSDSIFYSSTD